MNIEAFCDTLADHIQAGLSELQDVYPLPQVNVQSQTVMISPAPEWGTWGDEQSFCDPEVSYELILIAATTDFRSSMSWFMARLEEIRTVFDDDPYIDATCDGISVAGWSQPSIVPTGSGDALAVRVRLNPVVIL